MWCGTTSARRAYRGGLSASGPVELFRVNGFAFAALCGRTSNLYPTPGTESMNRGAFGSGSILRRRRAPGKLAVRAYGGAVGPATAERRLARDRDRRGLAVDAVS